LYQPGEAEGKRECLPGRQPPPAARFRVGNELPALPDCCLLSLTTTSVLLKMTT
jgi:hypothetical protein